MKSSKQFKRFFWAFLLVGYFSTLAEGTREILVNSSLVFDSTKRQPSEFYGIQFWDQSDTRRKSGTYQSITSNSSSASTQADAIYRIKIRICNLGEVINLGFNQPNNDIFWRLYKPDGTTVQFNDNTLAANGDASPSLTEQGAAGNPFTYRLPGLYTITGATNANPIVITTSTPHGFASNNVVNINGVVGNLAANGNFRITVLTATTFSLQTLGGVNVPGTGAYTSGGRVSGSGFVRTYAEAAVGPLAGEVYTGLPATYAGRAGYRPLQHIADQTGDYYIAFNPTQPDNNTISKRIFSIFDISVWNSIGSRTFQPGRLYCAAWDINCGSLNDPASQFNARLFFYSKDSVVTSVSFNQMRPYGFVVTANSRGVSNTGNDVNDRKSTILFNGFPEYPIFLNSPIRTGVGAYQVCGFTPKSSFGQVDTAFISGCDNDRCINIRADRTATVGISLLPDTATTRVTGATNATPIVITTSTAHGLLTGNIITITGINGNTAANGTFNVSVLTPTTFQLRNQTTLANIAGNGAYTSGGRVSSPQFTPRILDDQLITANTLTCIPWDGKDGAGNKIVGPLKVTINYYNGLTNLPLFDVEEHRFGYRIDLVAPSASPGSKPILVYWDDRPLASSGVTNFTAGRALDGFYDTPTSGSIGSNNVGNFATGISTSTYNLFGCDPSIDNNPTLPGTQGCHLWADRGRNPTPAAGINVYETHNTWWNANVIEKVVNYVPSNIEVYAMRSHAPLPIGTAPYAGTPNDTTVCSNINGVLLNPLVRREDPAGSGTFVNHTGRWTIVSGTGTFQSTGTNTSTTLNDTYLLSAAERTSGGMVVLRIVSDSTILTPCGTANDTMRIIINVGPDVSAGTDQSICKTTTTVTLNGNISGSTATYQWFASVPGGIFVPNAQTLNATYQAPASIVNASGTSTVTLKLKSLTNTGSIACPADSDDVVITYLPGTVVSLPDPAPVCNTQASVSLTGTVDGGSSTTGYTINWIGNGSFSGTGLTRSYTPTAAERAAGTARIILSATKTSIPVCAEARDTAIITFVAPPIANAGLDGIFCSNRNDTIALAGSTSGSITSTVWSCTNCSGGTFNNASTLSTYYDPSNTDKTQSSLTFVLTANSAACPPVTDEVTVNITQVGTVTINPIAVCLNNPCGTLQAPVAGGIWSSSTGSGTFNPSTASQNVEYCMDASEISAGIAQLLYTIPSDGNCLARSGSALMIGDPADKPFAGNDLSVCYNNNSVTLSQATAAATGVVTWSTLTPALIGPGTFNNANVTNPTYTLTQGELDQGTVTLVMSLQTTGCNPERDTVVLTVNPAPTVDAGPDHDVCANNASVTLNGNVSAGTPTWSFVSGVAGTFSNANSLTTVFTASTTPASPSTTVVRLTTNVAGCNPVFQDAVINYTPSPVVTITSNTTETRCKSNPNVNLSATVANASNVQWFIVSGSGIFSPKSDSLRSTYIPSATDLNNGFVTVRARSIGNGNCNSVNSVATVTISYTNEPTVSMSAPQTLCENSSSSVNISGSFTPSGVSAQNWTSSSGCISCFGNSTLASTSYLPSAQDIANGSVTLTLSSTGGPNGCGPVQGTTTITFAKAPTVNAGPDQVLCTNQNTATLAGSSTNSGSVQWQRLTGSGTINSATSVNTTYAISAQDKIDGTVILRLTANGSAGSGCQAVFDDVVIQFTNISTLNAGPDRTICANDLPIQLDGSGASGIWSTATTGTFTPGTSTSNATFQPSSTAPATITFTYAVGATGPCPAVSDQVVYTLIAAPTTGFNGPLSLCAASATSVTVNSGSSTGAGIWLSSGTGSFGNINAPSTTYTPSAADRAAGSVNIIFQTTNNGVCSAVSDTIPLTITDLSISAGPDQNQCGSAAGSTFTLNGSALLNGVSTPGLISGWSRISGAGSVSGTSTATYTLGAGDVPVLPATTSTVVLRMNTNATGACPALSDDVTITLQLAPAVNASSDNTNECETATAINLSGTISGLVTSGTWSPVNGTGSFFPSNVFNSAQSNVTYVPSLADTALTTIIFRLTADNNLCGSSVSDDVSVTLDPRPIVNAGNDITLCANNNVYTLAGTIANVSTGTWSSSSGCTTCFLPSTAFGAALQYDADTNDIANGFVTLTLVSSMNGACPADSDKVVVRFSEGPTVNAGPDRTICGNNRTFNVLGTVNAPFTANWTRLSDGLPTGFVDPSLNTTSYTASSADTLAGFVELVFTSIDLTGLCAPDRDTMRVTITDAPQVIFASSALTACSDTFFVALDANTNLSANPAGTWSGGSGTFINLNASSDTAYYVPSVTEREDANANGTETITLQFITAPGFCQSDTGELTITLNASPKIAITTTPGDSTEICANQNTINLSASLGNATGLEWRSSGSGGTFSPNNTDPNAVYTFSPMDKAAGTITFTAITTTGIGTCFAARDQYKVKIQPLPVANAGADVTICQNTPSVSLFDASVLHATGGTWTPSGSGVVGPTFNTVNGTYFLSACCFPVLDTAQTSVSLTLTTTGNGLCPAGTDTKIIRFTKLPLVDAGTADTICADNLQFALNADTSRASGFTWSALNGGTFSPSNVALNAVFAPTGVGNFRVVATANGNGSCGAVTDTLVITVRDVPTISLGNDGNICAIDENANTQFSISGLVLGNATGVSWSTSGTGSFDLTDPLKPVYLLSAQDINNGTVVFSASTNAGIGVCNPVVDQLSLSINKAPVANAGPDMSICETATTVTLNGLLTNSTTGSWASDSLAVVFDDPNNLNATYTFTNGSAGKIIPVVLTAIGQGACGPDTDTLLITYTNSPSLSVGSDQAECFLSNADVLTFQLNSGGVSGTWTVNAADPAPIFTPNANTPNAIYTPSAGALTDGNVVTLTFTTADVCYVTSPSDQLTVTLRTTPLLNTSAAANVCETTASTNLSTLVSQGTSGVQWTLLQGFGSLSNSNTTNATYLVNVNDKNLSQVQVIVSTTSALCPVDQDTVSFAVDANPIVHAGPDQLVCADLLNNAGAIQLAGSFSHTTGITWSSAQGTAVVANSINSTFTATSFPATVTITPLANGTCPGTPDNMVISAASTPVVALLSSRDTCAEISPINLASALDVGNANYTTSVWSAVPGNGNGSFVPNANTLNAQYVPTAADTARGSVQLILTATNTGVCLNSYDDTIQFNFDRRPVVNAGADLTFCAQNRFIALSGSATGALDGVQWGTAGTGTFSTATILNPVYSVSSVDSLNGGTILFLHTTNGATISCPDDTDFVALVLTPAPVAIVNAGFDQYLCIDNTSANLNGFILNASGGLWKIAQGSGQLSDSTDLNATYVFSQADASLDTIILVLQSVGHDQLCQPTVDTVRIIFTPAPTITTGADASVCASNPVIQLGNSVSAPSTNQGVWTSNGDGVFSPNEFTIGAQYFPGPTDIANGKVGFTLTSTSNGTCVDSYSRDTSTTIIPFVQADADATDIMCANDTSNNLHASSSTGSGIWNLVTQDGTITALNTAGTTARFLPGTLDKINQTAAVRFVTTGSACAPDSVQILIEINPAPVVNAGLDRTICADVIDGGVQVSGQVTVASSGVWRTSGTGSFINTTVSGTTIKTITATYVPSATDTSGAVVLTLESSGNLSSGGAICIQESDAMTLTFIPEPVVNANANGTCVSTTGIGLTGQVSQDPTYYPSASGQWSSSGTGTFAPDAFTGVATYVPSASDINNGSVTITWSSIGAASCQPNTRSLLLNTAPLPLADAGADQFTCNNAIVNLNASPYGVGSTYEWALLGNAAGTAGSGLSREVTVVGSYVLTLTDRFGCQNTDTVVVNTVTIPAALALAPQDCYDYYLFLQLTPQPTNLDPRGSFQWSYGGVLMSGENKDSVRVHSPGVYSLEYTFGACEAAFGSTEVNDVPRVRTPDFIGCSSASVFANVELINDTVPNYTFQWFNPSMALVTTTNDDATQVSLPTSTQVGFDTLTYYVRVTDGNGCDVNDSVWVISVPRPVPGLSTDSLQCETLLLDIDGSIPPQSNVDMLDPFNPVYRWYETSNASVTLDTDTMLTTGTTGFYVFEVTVGQCVGDDTINLRFQPYPGKVLPTDVTQCFERATTALLDAGDGGIPATNADFTAMHYDWNGAGTGIDDTLRTFTVDQSFFTTDVEDLTYTVDLSAQYSYLSCPVTDTIQVHDVCAPRLFPPTAFHPGDANTQDGVFTVKGKYFTNYKIRIFNRWGEVIFSSEDVNESWDGTYRGELMPVGVYAFMITYTGKADEYEGPFAKEGRVVLIR